MRYERMLVVVLLAIPVIVALVVWPAFWTWATAPAPQASATGPTATSAAVTDSGRKATPSSDGVPATIVPEPVNTSRAPTGAAVPAAAVEPTPSARATDVTQTATTRTVPTVARAPASGERTDASDDPSATIRTFYELVANRQYGAAAQLWSPRMRANFPPSENIDHRFDQTQSVIVQRADVVSEDPANGNAAVAVDVLESRQDGAYHWVGTWHLVRGPSGWLLDQPQLSTQ